MSIELPEIVSNLPHWRGIPVRHVVAKGFHKGMCISALVNNGCSLLAGKMHQLGQIVSHHHYPMLAKTTHQTARAYCMNFCSILISLPKKFKSLWLLLLYVKYTSIIWKYWILSHPILETCTPCLGYLLVFSVIQMLLVFLHVISCFTDDAHLICCSSSGAEVSNLIALICDSWCMLVEV
jgi:hypothetical protein